MVILFSISVNVSGAPKITSELVEKWLDSQIAVIEWSKPFQEQLSQSEISLSPVDATTSDILKPIKEANLLASFSGVVAEYGFNDANSWASTTLIITRVAAAIAMEADDPLAQLPAAELIDANPNLSEEEKEQIKGFIAQTREAVASIKQSVNPEDLAVLRPYIDRINAALSSD